MFTRDPADKRQTILEAAVHLFAGRGFHGTPVPMVAEKAKVGLGTIYRYFADKEVLVNEVYRHYKIEFSTAIIASFPVDGSPREQLRSLWRAMTQYATANPDVVRFCELHHHADYLDRESLALEDRLLTQFVNMLDEAKNSAGIKDMAGGVLFAIVWGSFLTMMRGIWEGRILNTQENMSDAEACVWDAIRRH